MAMLMSRNSLAFCSVDNPFVTAIDLTIWL